MTNPAVEALALKIHTASLPSLTLDEARVIAQSAFDTTAAAQVGEPTEDRAAQKIIEPIIKDAITTAVDLTIERCAQVLEAAYAECNTLNLLHGAARLRKLKDAP